MRVRAPSHHGPFAKRAHGNAAYVQHVLAVIDVDVYDPQAVAQESSVQHVGAHRLLGEVAAIFPRQVRPV